MDNLSGRILNESQIAEIDQRQRAASDGPWHSGCLSNEKSTCNCTFILSPGHCGAVAQVCFSETNKTEDGDNPLVEDAKANQIFIANARHDVPLLIESHRALMVLHEKKIKELSDVLKEVLETGFNGYMLGLVYEQVTRERVTSENLDKIEASVIAVEKANGILYAVLRNAQTHQA